MVETGEPIRDTLFGMGETVGPIRVTLFESRMVIFLDYFGTLYLEWLRLMDQSETFLVEW